MERAVAVASSSAAASQMFGCLSLYSAARPALESSGKQGQEVAGKEMAAASHKLVAALVDYLEALERLVHTVPPLGVSFEKVDSKL